MRLLLLPWIAYWTSVPLFPGFGAHITLVIAAAMPLFYAVRKATVYDAISVFSIVVLCVMTLLGIEARLLVLLSYFIFGLLWLGSLFTKIPLCAWYSSTKWGGDAAFENPLFLLTNRIICAAWGIAYLVSSFSAWFIMGSAYAPFAGIINQGFSAAMGLFTALFSSKFPAYYAGKKRSPSLDTPPPSR